MCEWLLGSCLLSGRFISIWIGLQTGEKCHNICIMTVHILYKMTTTGYAGYAVHVGRRIPLLHMCITSHRNESFCFYGLGSVWRMFLSFMDLASRFFATHFQGRKWYRLSVQRCGHIGLRLDIDTLLFGWKRVKLCAPSPTQETNITIVAHSKLPPGILVHNRVHLLTYPLGAPPPLYSRACLHRVWSVMRVPNSHCTLFTLMCFKAYSLWCIPE
jgi:hypothetical protein